MAGEKPWDPELYEGQHSFVWKAAHDLLTLLGPRPGERILDLGCGTGQLTHEIAASGALVWGIDKSAAMIATARRHYPEIRFEEMDAAELRLDRRFHAVFSNAALHWMTRAADVATSVHEVLAVGGRFVAEMGGKGNVGAIYDALAEAIRGAGHTPVPQDSLLYFPSLGEHASLLERAGLRVAYATHFDRPTRLEGGEAGMRNWIAMFADRFLGVVPEAERDAVLGEVERRLRPHLYRDGAWHADYVRLRIVAVREL
jgi:trans-aconitate methyltransferase